MNNCALSIENYNLKELSLDDQMNTNGGTPAVVAVLAVGGMCVGALLVGAAVGYGLYKLVDYCTS